MIFTTWPFVVFMAFVLGVYWWGVPAGWRRGFLLAASLAYFTYSYPIHTLLLGGLTVTVYAIGSTLQTIRTEESARTRARALLVSGLVLCAGILGFFKYSRMLAGVWNAALQELSLHAKLPAPQF